MEPAVGGQDAGMWLAPVVFLGIVLVIVGIITGVGYLWIPVLVVLAIIAVLHSTVMRSSGDKTGRLEKGPAQDTEGRGHPEDTPGGPFDDAKGYAHDGQGAMTPDQVRRRQAT